MIKRSLIAGAVSLALFSSVALAQTWTDTGGTVLPGVNDRSNATQAPGYCQIAVTATASSLATLLASGSGGMCSVPTWATAAFFRPATAGIAVVRSTPDTTTPTAALGFPHDGQTSFPMSGSVQGGTPFSTIKCISTSGSSVTMDILWMG